MSMGMHDYIVHAIETEPAKLNSGNEARLQGASLVFLVLAN